MALLGVLVYAHTLHAPWYLDDHSSILANDAVRNLGEAFSVALEGDRGLTNLTFALNFALGGVRVAGYHLVNIALHLAVSCLTYLLLKRVFPGRRDLALGGSLLFVCHPVQTQAVTYVVQRMTTLSALFFFLGLYLYVRALERGLPAPRGGSGAAKLRYAGALLCGAAAVLVKQNTAVLPVALLLFESYFVPAAAGRP
ncbi:MAG: tetratricopeptide repeat protein, partial [Deltaproteobacteria bacterium]|nr:tetratricopeptide repeat protein [Deltaproteobacteria bacterium]